LLRQAAPAVAETEATEPVGGQYPPAADIGRVLLAFDRPFERRALGFALSRARVSVVEVDFAAAAQTLEVAAGRGEPFDRIVVDGAEGAAATGRLLSQARDLNSLQPVRGIVLVNVLSRSSLSEFRAVGFDAYLVRPVRPSSMMMQLGLGENAEIMAADEPEGRPAPDAAAATVHARRRVLLAEDNEINALLARRVLERCGCEFVAVTNGRDAVAAVRSALETGAPSIDLILMDIFMPHLDGIEASREIRALYAAHPGGAASGPPIVALTASAFAEDKKRYLEAGLDDYLAKPFDKAALEAVLGRWLRRGAGAAA
jgi:CheY-like chemotaxis protein